MMKSAYPPSVVFKAFTWAYQDLGLTQSEAAELLDISESALRQTLLLGFESGTLEYRRQLSFIRMYHLLIALSEGDTDAMRMWFHSYQGPINASPKDLCFADDGIEKTTHYLRELKQDSLTGTLPTHALSLRSSNNVAELTH
jgi:hypothetical protein